MCKTNHLRPRDEAEGAEAFAARLAALAATPARFAAIVATVDPAAWRRHAKDGNFSLLEHACHLRDIEIEAYRARIERMLAETQPPLADVDGGRLARERDYYRHELRSALAAFTAVRADMVCRLARLTPEERQRTGALEGVGVITIDGLVAAMLTHDREHLADLETLRGELRG